MFKCCPKSFYTLSQTDRFDSSMWLPGIRVNLQWSGYSILSRIPKKKTHHQMLILFFLTIRIIEKNSEPIIWKKDYIFLEKHLSVIYLWRTTQWKLEYNYDLFNIKQLMMILKKHIANCLKKGNSRFKEY